MGDDPAKNCKFSKKKSGSRRAIYHWATEPLEFGKNSLPQPRTFSRGKIIEIPRFLVTIFRLGAMRLKMKIFKKGNSVLFFMGATWWKITISTKGKWSRLVVFQKYIFRMGTMRLKVTIFKKWNKITKSCGGRCVKKWRFSKGETAFAGYKKFQMCYFM